MRMVGEFVQGNYSDSIHYKKFSSFILKETSISVLLKFKKPQWIPKSRIAIWKNETGGCFVFIPIDIVKNKNLLDNSIKIAQ